MMKLPIIEPIRRGQNMISPIFWTDPDQNLPVVSTTAFATAQDAPIARPKAASNPGNQRGAAWPVVFVKRLGGPKP